MSPTIVGTPMEHPRAQTAAPDGPVDASDDPVDLMGLRGVVLDGRYEIGEPLTTGGMGALYRGQQLALQRPVVVKLVKPGIKDHELQVRRLVREAQTTAMVKHPNVIEIIDVGVMDGGFVYLVMEELEGEDLKALLRKEGRLPWGRARNIAMQVVAALKAAHARGVIHRDIKPSNVFLVDQAPGVHGDFIKVLDFGLAKCSADGRTPTLTGAAEVVGTAAYLAPEVARGRKADVRSEVYAVGVLMYKMATGTVPFKGTNPLDILAKAISNPVPAPRTRNPMLPAEADRIIRRCLAKRPDLRPQDMDALERDLHALGEDAPQAAPVVSARAYGAAETTQVTPAPLAPPPSAPRVEPSPVVPTFVPIGGPQPGAGSSSAEDPSDVLEAAMSDLLELDENDAELELDAEEVGGLIPEPFSDDPSLGPVVQSQTAVAPLPPRPNPPRPSLDDRFAADLPRDARGFAPAIDTAAPSIPSFGDARMASEASPVPARSGRGRFLMLMLAVPALAALVVAGLWAAGVLPGDGDGEQSVAVAGLAEPDASESEGVPKVSAVTWDEGFRAVPDADPSPHRVGAPAWFTPPKLRRLDPSAAVPQVEPTSEAAAVAPVAESEPPKRTPKKRSTRSKKTRRRSKPEAEPEPARRPPPPPPVVPSGKKKPKKRRATDPSAPWKRVPVPSDNW